MIYVYDILLNWFEEKKNIEFFEWDPKDELEHIKRIPLFRVTKETMKEFMKNTIFFSSMRPARRSKCFSFTIRP